MDGTHRTHLSGLDQAVHCQERPGVGEHAANHQLHAVLVGRLGHLCGLSDGGPHGLEANDVLAAFGGENHMGAVEITGRRDPYRIDVWIGANLLGGIVSTYPRVSLSQRRQLSRVGIRRRQQLQAVRRLDGGDQSVSADPHPDQADAELAVTGRVDACHAIPFSRVCRACDHLALSGRLGFGGHRMTVGDSAATEASA